MKKLALVLAIVLIACMAFVACDNNKSGNNANNSTENTQSTNQGGNTNSTNQGGDNNSTNQGGDNSTSQGGATTQHTYALYDMADNALGITTKGTVITGTLFATNDIKSVGNNKVTTSGGRTAKDGTMSGTTFTVAVQLQKGTTTGFTEKPIQFTTTVANQTVEIYVNCGTTDKDGKLYFCNAASEISNHDVPNAGITCVTLTIATPGSYAIHTDNDFTMNVWGIYM